MASSIQFRPNLKRTVDIAYTVFQPPPWHAGENEEQEEDTDAMAMKMMMPDDCR